VLVMKLENITSPVLVAAQIPWPNDLGSSRS
jgi:hypothetical protein